MLKALLRKQFSEISASFLRSRKTGEKRSGKDLIFYVILLIVIFASLGVTFGGVSYSLASPLNEAGLGWLYFSIMFTLAIALGVFGSVFNTYAGLYKAKDNDLLLSMPIPAGKILFSRLVGVFAMGMFYEILVIVPAVAVFFAVTGFSLAGVLCSLVLILLTGLIVLVLTCILGWVVALVSVRIKNKSFVTVIASLLFLAVYYLVFFRISSFLQNITLYVDVVSGGIHKYAYPLYMLGKAALGNIPFLLIIAAVTFALTYLTYFVLSKSFMSITTSSQPSQVTKAKKGKTVQSALSRALFRKELKRFTSSPTYMLNCGLGVVLMPVAAVAILVKKELITGYIGTLGEQFPFAEKLLPVIICCALCLISSMIDITAPSVSLEGKNIWIVQSMPVESKYVLDAKVKLHLALAEPPAIISSLIILTAFGADVKSTVICTAFVFMFIYLSALFGLFLNLKMPNLSWQNETVPVKQGMSVTIALFGGWLISVIIVGIFWFLKDKLSPIDYIEVCIAVFVVLSVILQRFIYRRGAEIFDTLS